MTFTLAILIGIPVLGILVFVHELGHFLMAKACKINVLTFSLGFGAPLIKKSWKGTEYRISAIPFGGYVRMAGENPEEEHNGSPDEFSSKPIWQRALVALAGPVANFLFAMLLLWIAFMYGVERPLYLDNSIVGAVVDSSAADKAGFQPEDTILAINGQSVKGWGQIETHLGQQLKKYVLKVKRDDQILKLDMRIKRSGPGIPENPTGGLLPPTLPSVVGSLTKNSVAKEHLQKGDTLLSVDGKAVSCFEQFALEVGDYKPSDSAISINVKRQSKTFDVNLTPRFDSTRNRYLLGIGPAKPQSKYVSYGPGEAAGHMMDKSREYTTMIFDVLSKLFSGQVSASQLSGPLGIIPASGMMALQGFSNILDFMALIGINLGVLNLLPLVITDGGLIVFLGIEAVRGKPLSLKTQMTVNKVAMIFFLGLFIFVSINDIIRIPDFLRIFK
ncbi:MAG: RIP metalloprotease RseP [Chitinispirillaceae bacterium]